MREPIYRRNVGELKVKPDAPKASAGQEKLTNYVSEARDVVLQGIKRTPNLPDYVKPLAKAIVGPLFSALSQAIGGFELTVYRTEQKADSVPTASSALKASGVSSLKSGLAGVEEWTAASVYQLESEHGSHKYRVVADAHNARCATLRAEIERLKEITRVAEEGASVESMQKLSKLKTALEEKDANPQH